MEVQISEVIAHSDLRGQICTGLGFVIPILDHLYSAVSRSGSYSWPVRRNGKVVGMARILFQTDAKAEMSY